MKVYKRIAIIAFVIQLMFLLVVLLGFHVDDTTLSKGKVRDWNAGWTLVRSDGTEEAIDSLPYQGTSGADETVVLRTKVPKEYAGKTFFFLSADKKMKIWLNDVEIYTFGAWDIRLFGHTPGSVTNFVNLPDNLGDRELQIEMSSHYKNYATYLSNIRVADRDVAILQVIKENMGNIICSIAMIFLALFLIALSVLQGLSNKPQNGMTWLAAILIWASIYYAIETKILHVFFGNQTFYSMAIFLFLLYIPILFCQYYSEILPEYNKVFRILMGLSFCNMAVQLVLQITNVVDFMDMVFVSHLLLAVSVVFVLFKLLLAAHKSKNGNLWLQVVALFIVGVGLCIDMGRSYVIKVGDLGKYSRYAFTLYGVIMVIVHIQRIVQDSVAEEIRNKEYLEQEVDRQTKVLQNNQKKMHDMLGQTITALSQTVDAKDRYTNGHSKRVAEYSKMLAARMGKSEEEQEQIYYAGLLHDVGKIRIPDDIINKPGRLTQEEFNYIKLHPVTGYNILKCIEDNPVLAIGAKFHHERYDGSGYPNGLVGDNIPEVARIIGVADAYDAMTSNRSYRNAMTQQAVREQIEQGRGTQFDPKIADHMLALIDQDTEFTMHQTRQMHKNILVVDDEIINVEIIESIMQDEPMYKMYRAMSGEEALQQMEHRTFDLVLLDIIMPGMDGFETLRRIREHYDVPVVFLSADRTEEALERAQELKVDEYITKPFLPLELKEVLHSLTSQ